MMMITRTETRLEVGLQERGIVTIDVDRICGAMLAAERLPCGRLAHSLLLMVGRDADPVRIDGDPAELNEMHAYIVETMLACEKPAQPGSRFP